MVMTGKSLQKLGNGEVGVLSDGHCPRLYIVLALTLYKYFANENEYIHSLT